MKQYEKECSYRNTLRIMCLLACWVRWCYVEKGKVSYSINDVIGERRYLEDCVADLLTVSSVNADSLVLRRGEECFSLSDCVSYPCLVIYLPSVQEDICGSCLFYAINEAQNSLGALFGSKNVCIISLGDNPEIKERIYKKRVYITDRPLLAVPKAYMPYYFILEENGSVNSLFCPNSAFEEHTSAYLANIGSMRLF